MQVITSQLSGKFSKQDNKLFELRRKLIAAGVEVEFPFNDKIISEYKGIPITFIPTADRTFYDIEIAFYQSIRKNPVHIVHNRFGEMEGYIGESVSIEIAYAILHNKPVILLFAPFFTEKVPLAIRALIETNCTNLFIQRIDLMSKVKLISYISEA